MEHAEPHPEEPPQAPSSQDSDANAKDEETGGYYGKPKEKEKIMKAVSTAAPGGIWSRIAHWLVMADRMARASMAFRKEKEKGNPMAASPKDMAGNRPTYIKGKGKKRNGFKGNGYGKRPWYSTTPGATSTTSTTGFHGLSAKPGRSLDNTDGIPNSNTSLPSAAVSESLATRPRCTPSTRPPMMMRSSNWARWLASDLHQLRSLQRTTRSQSKTRSTPRPLRLPPASLTSRSILWSVDRNAGGAH